MTDGDARGRSRAAAALLTRRPLRVPRSCDRYARLGLPCSIHGITAETYKRATRDITIHRDGLLRAPLPRGIGACTYADAFSDAEVEAAFARLEGFMAEHPETCWDRSWSFAADGAEAAGADADGAAARQ